ncbi:hypothetical protein HDZ31DRAFT_48795, partial [Schizophyllum fasciatum]
HCHRKTVTALDVVYALKRSGKTLYGFGAYALRLKEGRVLTLSCRCISLYSIPRVSVSMSRIVLYYRLSLMQPKS